MPDPTPPTPAPAHPWRKTARTVLAGLATAAITIPVIVDELGLDLESETWAWLAGVLVVLGLITRLLALPSVNKVLGMIGLGHDDVEAGQVLALVIPEAESPDRIVAGAKAVQPTGTPLPASTTIEQLAGAPPGP